MDRKGEKVLFAETGRGENREKRPGLRSWNVPSSHPKKIGKGITSRKGKKANKWGVPYQEGVLLREKG